MMLAGVLDADIAEVGEVIAERGVVRQIFSPLPTCEHQRDMRLQESPLGATDSLAAAALQSGALLLSSNVADDDRFQDEALRALGVRSALCAPLHLEGEPLAVLGALRTGGQPWDETDGQLAEAIAQQVQRIVGRVRREEARRRQRQRPGLPSGFDNRTSPRREYPYRQQIAPMHSGLIPSPDKFFTVRCKDLSSGGVAIYLQQPPDFQNLVVSLGMPPSVRHFTAEVMHVAEVAEAGATLYRLGCRFTGRVYL